MAVSLNKRKGKCKFKLNQSSSVIKYRYPIGLLLSSELDQKVNTLLEHLEFLACEVVGNFCKTT